MDTDEGGEQSEQRAIILGTIAQWKIAEKQEEFNRLVRNMIQRYRLRHGIYILNVKPRVAVQGISLP